MKYTKKFFALLLALTLSIGIFSGCQTSDSPETDSAIPSSSQVEETTETATDGYQKQYCTATIDDPFHGQYVYVTLVPSASDKTYTLEDFPEYEFKKIDTIVLSSRPPEEPRIILELALTNPSKENALEAIKLLEQRPDAYSVNPDYYLKLDATPTDSYYTDGTQNEFNIISLPSAWNLSTGSNAVRKHTHTFSSNYTSKNATSHEAYCVCGAHKPETHSFTQSGSTLICSKCGYSSISLNNQGLEVEMQ